MAEAAIARKTGEGFDKPNAEANLPLDINYQNLTEWLVARQKVPKDWNKRLQAIQAKAQQEAQTLPAGLLASLPGGTEAPLDYFRAVEIRDKLAVTSERTLFGGLSGAAGQWDKIVKAYEKQAVYLGESALTLVQAVDYDIPYLRKQQARHNQTVSDLERKQAEYLKGATTCATNYKSECQKLGIAGASVRAELAALCKDLPPLLQAAVGAMKDGRIGQGAVHYSEWAAFAHGASAGASGSASASGSGSAEASALALLPTLAEVRAGRTAPPAAAASAPAASTSAAAAPAINWDLDLDLGGSVAATSGGAAAPTADIDWDIDLSALASEAAAAGEGASLEAAPVEVSWDIGAVEDGGGAAAAGGGIDWDIDMTETGADAGNAAGAIEIDWGIDAGASGSGGAAGPGGIEASAALQGGSSSSAPAGLGGVGGDPDETAALRLERDAEYRARVLDDLQELRGFLLMRKSALASSGQELINAALPPSIQEVDGSSVASMLEGVEAAVKALTAPRLRELLLIASSQRYLDRLVASLQRKAGQEGRMRAAAADTLQRRNEARAALAAAAPKTAALLERCKRLKADAEGAVSGMFAGRRVNILGDINTVLYSSS